MLLKTYLIYLIISHTLRTACSRQMFFPSVLSSGSLKVLQDKSIYHTTTAQIHGEACFENLTHQSLRAGE